MRFAVSRIEIVRPFPRLIRPLIKCRCADLINHSALYQNLVGYSFTVGAALFANQGFTADIAPGQSLARSLDVQVNRNAAGAITHVGRLLFMDGLQAQPVGVDSNPVRMVVPDQPPTLRLFRDANYTRPLTVLTAGQPFYVAFNAARCNLDHCAKRRS